MTKTRVTKNTNGSVTVRIPRSANLASLPKVTTRVRMRGKSMTPSKSASKSKKY